MIKLIVEDGTCSHYFGPYNDGAMGHYEKDLEKWPWDAPPMKGIEIAMGGESFPIVFIYLDSDGTTVVTVHTDDAVAPSWYKDVLAEGYVFKPVP